MIGQLPAFGVKIDARLGNARVPVPCMMITGHFEHMIRFRNELTTL